VGIVRSFLQGLAIAGFITLMLGLRAALYPVIEWGGLPITIAIITSCLLIAHRWERV